MAIGFESSTIDVALAVDVEHQAGHEEREESETLGGLASLLAGRVPARGEILTHETGIVFEVLDADPRRVKKLKIRNLLPLSARQ